MAEIVSTMNIEVEDQVGKLAEITRTLKQAGLDIKALCAWVEGKTGRMILVTDDNDKACASLADQVGACHMSQCLAVTVPDQIGALEQVASKLAEAGIAINFVAATTSGGQEAMILMDTADNAEAARLV